MKLSDILPGIGYKLGKIYTLATFNGFGKSMQFDMILQPETFDCNFSEQEILNKMCTLGFSAEYPVESYDSDFNINRRTDNLCGELLDTMLADGFPIEHLTKLSVETTDSITTLED